MTQTHRMTGMTMATTVSVPSGGALVPVVNNKQMFLKSNSSFFSQIRHDTPKCKPKKSPFPTRVVKSHPACSNRIVVFHVVIKRKLLQYTRKWRNHCNSCSLKKSHVFNMCQGKYYINSKDWNSKSYHSPSYTVAVFIAVCQATTGGCQHF